MPHSEGAGQIARRGDPEVPTTSPVSSSKSGILIIRISPSFLVLISNLYLFSGLDGS
jgi:hypothetical protein